MIFRNELSPVAFRIALGGQEFAVRWYGLAYVAGLALAFIAFRREILSGRLRPATERALDRLFTASLAGVIVGGRLGYVLQNPKRMLEDPLFPFKVWEGGMAFFGGLIGVIIGLAWVAKREQMRLLALTDAIAPAAMLGLALGRIANFANAELWGRPTYASWGVIYPRVDNLPRHPSELSEAASHIFGFLVLVVLQDQKRRTGPASAGLLSGLFLALYGILRVITDFWREEPLLGYLNAGQWASAFTALVGICLALRSTASK